MNSARIPGISSVLILNMTLMFSSSVSSVSSCYRLPTVLVPASEYIFSHLS